MWRTPPAVGASRLVTFPVTFPHFLIPPGTAKSELGRRLSTLTNGSYFERLLTRFSVPEELFGPLSLKALEQDRFERKTDGYLPAASIAFLDEIFKANSSILNSLLSILNERLYDNGNARVKVPLLCLVGASNELPESEELDALYDRFLLRAPVLQVSQAGLEDLLRLACGTPDVSTPTATTADEMQSLFNVSALSAVRDEARAVILPNDVVSLLVDLRSWLQESCEPPIYVSDRRLVKAVAMLRVAAHCSGRTAVSTMDCLLLEHVMMQRPEQAPSIRDWLLKRCASEDSSATCRFIFRGLFGRLVRAKTAADRTLLLEEARKLRATVELELSSLASSPSSPAIRASLWLGGKAAERASQTLYPQLAKTRKGLEEVLKDVVIGEVSLEMGARPEHMAVLLPEQWKHFVRVGDDASVRPHGVVTDPATAAGLKRVTPSSSP